MAKENVEEYDYLIIGTGLAETALSSTLSNNKNVKILHIDPNATYGSEFSTLQYSQLLKHFKRDQSTNGSAFQEELSAKNKEFNIDLTPKMLLQESDMKDFLLENNIQDLVNFTSIKGSYLFTDRLHSIPTSEAKALKSSTVSFSQKFKVINFFWNVRKYANNPNIPTQQTMLEEFQSFGLSQESIDFIGHAIALNLNDEYLKKEPSYTYNKIICYVSSIVSYENSESPYLYPMYGLSEICQAFARRSALNGTVFMLRAIIKKMTENEILLEDPNNELLRIKANKIICDPKYWPGSKISKEIIRGIMIIKKESQESRNIVFLKQKLQRNHDVFCIILGSSECVCPEGYEVGIISTVKETDDPEKEIKHVLSKFTVLDYFIETRLIYENQDLENVLFTSSVDESPLFDGVYNDIKRICNKLNSK